MPFQDRPQLGPSPRQSRRSGSGEGGVEVEENLLVKPGEQVEVTKTRTSAGAVKRVGAIYLDRPM